MNTSEMKGQHYGKFLLTLLISFCIMYAVMFFNVDSIDHIHLSLTRLYMALLMVTPMALLMLLAMPMMFKDKRLNNVIMLVSIVLFVLSFAALRNQWFITDRQYMKAMIPHHSSAILTSKNANIRDTTVKKLSLDIIAAQEREIAEMEQMLKRLDK